MLPPSMVSNFKYHDFCITFSFPCVPNDVHLLWFSGKHLRGKRGILVLVSFETTIIHCQACDSVCASRWVMSYSVWLCGVEPTGLLCPWDCPSKNSEVGCHYLLQGIFPNVGIEPTSPALKADSLPSEPPGKLFSSVQLLSRVRLFATPWTTARQASLSITNSQSLLKLMSIKSVMPSNHLILCLPLLLLPSIFSSIRVFSNESVLRIRWPKDWSFSFSISPSSEHPGLISFRMDWSDLLAVQGILKSFLQHHSLKASILQCSAFFIVQLSHPYMTTGKTIALTRRTFLTKWCLCFLICCLDLS